MITEEKRLKLDNLSNLFLDRFEKTFKGSSYSLEFTDRLEVSIPSKDPRFGDIHIWLDGDEVTVGIGELFHTHFETYHDDSLAKQQAEDQATANAIEFIKDVLADQVVIEIQYDGNKPVRASMQYFDDNEASSVVIPVHDKKVMLKRIFPSKIKVKKLLWSGKEVK
ncbi:MAG: hypothetical protein K8R79_12365 [Calditrichales bacterium]|nr:hypothetical protein [Calditrichales bacterium]